ncbi:MAG: uroporphyrin-III C-methyltransferase, partial [Clostridia bacterium]|nr:uroporphyrin-III C-methyltransferase [Clostridia bacterium]
MTVRGLKLIQACDVLVYDDLIDEALLDEAPVQAMLMYMGKRSGHHSALQEEI